MLEESKALWNEFTNGTKPSENPVFSYPNNSSFNARTNPIGNHNKAKAFDLNSPNPKQQPEFLNRATNPLHYQQNRISE